MGDDIYRDFAEVYDYFYQHTEDIEFYVKMAKKYGSPILELGCGTGRVTLEIARNNFRITGLDSSESMLSILRKKLERESKQAKDNVKIVKGDIRDFSLGEKFNLIILPFSTVVHLLSVEDVLKAFTCVRSHLSEKGVFIFDVFNPKLEYLVKKKRIEFDIREVPNGEIVLWEVANYDLTNQFITVKRYGFVAMENSRKEFIWKTKLRYWFKTELELLLQMAGFKNIETYGGFNLEPYDYSTGKIVMIAHP